MPVKVFYICLLFATALSLSSPCYGDTNLLTNPGFESGTTGWSGFGCSFTTSTTIYHSGTKSGYAYGRTATWNGISQSLLGKMTAGKTYTLTYWIRLENASGNGDTIGATISKTDGSGTSYTQVGSTTAFNNEWTPISGSYTLTVSGTLTNLLLYFAGPAAGVNYYLDDVNLVLYEPPTPGPNATGQVNLAEVYQKLEGFGASGAWYEGWLTVHPARNIIYDILFKQLGLDIYGVRNCYNVDSGSASYIANTKQIVQEAKSRNPALKILLVAGSPPAYLKSNNDVNGFPQPGTLKKDANGVYMYDGYANWWATSLAAFESNSIHPDYIGMQNEPDFEAVYESCKFLPTEDSNYAGHDKALEAVYQKLYSQIGPNMPKLVAPDTMGFGGSKAFIHAIIDVNHVYGFAHHLYTDGDFNSPDDFIVGMKGYGQQYGYKPLLETEYAKLDGNTTDFTAAMNNARHIHNSLVYEGVSSYFYWDLFWGDSGGLVTLIQPWGPNPSYTINPVYYAFKHYAAFTDPNWYRVGASTDSNGLRITAFKSPDDSNLTVVILNVSPTVDINLSLSLNNYHPADSAIYQTKLNSNFAYVGTFNESSRLFLPHQSITTIRLTAPADCNDVQDANLGLLSDLNGDCYVDYKDLDVIADYWLSNNCASSNNCNGADFVPVDGTVNFLDFSDFASQWMQCNNPQDANCIPNW
ncbi:MAG: carbohydrate binding domain-containing protein [Sedimentisphaerales bacterium]